MTRRHDHDGERPAPRRLSPEEQLDGLALWQQPFAVTLPAEPRRSTPEHPQPMALAYAPGSETSEEAAERMAPRAELLRARVLRAYAVAGEAGLTADECALGLDEHVLAIRPRVTELHQLGWLEKTKRRGASVSGRTRATVLVITDAGRRRADALARRQAGRVA